MKRALVMFVLSLAIVSAAGCKKKEDKAADPAAGSAAAGSAAPGSAAATPTPPAAGDMTVDAACDKMIAAMESMGTAVETNAGNCDAMGTALEKWVADNKEFMTWAKAQDADAAKKQEFEEKCGPKMGPAMQSVAPKMAGAEACKDNEKVKAAMASME